MTWIQKTKCILNIALFLLLWTPLVASAWPDSWLVLQTIYHIRPIAGVEDDGSEKKCDILACHYCRNIVKEPRQDPEGNRVCADCSVKMQQFIAERKQKSMAAASASANNTESDHYGEYYASLLIIFPGYGGTREDAVKMMAGSNGELVVEEYKTHPDISHRITVTGFQRDYRIRCGDCGQDFDSDFFGVYSHAVEHRLVCEGCGFSPVPDDSTCEGSMPDLKQREQLLEEHQQRCVASCPHCHHEYLRAVLQCHEEACPERRIHCSSCNDSSVLLGEYSNHVIENYDVSAGVHDHHTVTCPVCQQSVPGLDYPAHYQHLHVANVANVGNVSNKAMSQACPYCDQSFYSGFYLLNHAKKKHASEMVKMMISQADNNHTGSDQHAENEHASLRKNLMCIIQIAKLSTPVKEVPGNMGTAAASVADGETLATLEQKLAALTLADREKKELIAVLTQQIKEIVQVLQKQVATLRQQQADLAGENCLSEKDKPLYAEAKGMVTDGSCQALTKKNTEAISSLTRRIADLELAMEALAVSSHDGTFLWRIQGVKKKRQNAMDGSVTGIFSPPFYTSRNGYKMCMRACLNGDGVGRGKKLSLFFVLMKGEDDPLLKWPFEHKVSVVLVDQTHRKHIVYAFRPTVDTRPFQQPVNDMNQGSGFPEFAGLDVLDNDAYVSDDVMFIKCIIDKKNMVYP